MNMLYYILTFVFVFILSKLLFKISIPILHKLKFGQVVRDDGPATHFKKQGTPTMGGIVFIICNFVCNIILIPILLSFENIKNHKNIIITVLFFTLSVTLFALIGFLDDMLKIKYKNSKGLKARYKFLLQIAVSTVFMLFLMFYMNEKYIKNPFTDENIFILNTTLTIFISFIINIFIITGTSNGVNFTDGLDGLLSSVTVVIAIFYICFSVKKQVNIYIILENIIVLAMLLSFLYFNHYPAKLFMGDTGSLFLGFYVAKTAIVLDIQLLLPVFGFIYFMEVISVILQVWYFKKTKGKRLFKMAPIHHHFEKLNMSENQIVFMFTSITIFLCIISWFIKFGL